MKKILIFSVILFALLLCGCTNNESIGNVEEEVLIDETDSSHEGEQASDDTIEEEVQENIEQPADSVVEEPSENIDNSQDEDTEVPAESDTPIEPEEVVQPVEIGVTDIKLSTYSVSVTVGEKKMPIVTMYPQNATNKKEIWTSSDTAIATVDGIGNIKGIAEGECTVTVTSADNPAVSAVVTVTVKAVPECTYIDGILIVNKTYPLPESYAPGWETEAAGPLWEMIAAAKKDGIKLWMTSGYRSYYDQQYIYNGYVKRDGQEKADTYSARPGHSEHQTGLAYDLNDLDHDFGDTPEGQWVAENCHKYGFILRYPKGKEEITGYMYEPWHIRYLGVEKATEVYESGLCLEEFLNITSEYAE